MFEDVAEALVWIMRIVLLGGIAWGAWLCIDEMLLPDRPEKMLGAERFATFALLILLVISTLAGGFAHAG